MPAKPRSYCGKCRIVHRNEECPHRIAFGRKRATEKNSERGGSKWRTTRKGIFVRDKFLCQIHLAKGLYVSVELHGPDHGVCDHIAPLAEGGANDESNLQTICQSCDEIKTQAESKRHLNIE
jgi:5-methylcytosine-specific restriction protein A